jgi:hypothetical protein
MLFLIIALTYVLLCILTGLCGTHRRLGFFGTFLLSLLITPVPVLLILMLTAPSYHPEKR